MLILRFLLTILLPLSSPSSLHFNDHFAFLYPPSVVTYFPCIAYLSTLFKDLKTIFFEFTALMALCAEPGNAALLGVASLLMTCRRKWQTRVTLATCLIPSGEVRRVARWLAGLSTAAWIAGIKGFVAAAVRERIPEMTHVPMVTPTARAPLVTVALNGTPSVAVLALERRQALYFSHLELSL